jgi:N-acetylglucosamine-6-phosphate deacetylase
VIEQATAAGWIVSLGHSNATYDEGVQAIVAGATRATHLFNAMAPLHHRQPGLVAACLESPQVFVELIADLVHLAPPLLRLTLQIVGAQRAVLITDSISATELPDGIHSLGGLTVTVENHVARLEDGTLAGSTLTMDRAVLNMTAIGVPFRESLMMATTVPARSIGERIGTLQPDGLADFLVLNEDLSISRVYAAGHRMV